MLLTVHRKKKFAGALCTYWVVTGMDINTFFQRTDEWSALPRLTVGELDSVSVRIKNGQTVSVDIDTPCEVFVVCSNGTLSQPLYFDGSADRVRCEIDTKGGWKTLPHPCLRLVE